MQSMKGKEGGLIILEVRRSNEAAIALYQRLGFCKIGERKNYYPLPKGREDAFVFERKI